MILQTTYIAESKRERKTLQIMSINMQESGMDVEFLDERPGTKQEHGGTSAAMLPAQLTVKESRRNRRSRQEIAEAALSNGAAHL